MRNDMSCRVSVYIFMLAHAHARQATRILCVAERMKEAPTKYSLCVCACATSTKKVESGKGVHTRVVHKHTHTRQHACSVERVRVSRARNICDMCKMWYDRKHEIRIALVCSLTFFWLLRIHINYELRSEFDIVWRICMCVCEMSVSRVLRDQIVL